MGRSSFDHVSAFLRQRSDSAPPAGMDEDVEVIVRRWERVRNLGDAFDQVELSPYLQSMLRTREQALVLQEAERTSAAAGG